MSLIKNPDKEIVYACSFCKRTNSKLWRDTHIFLDNMQLFCIECIAKKNPMENTSIDQNGMIPSSINFDQKTDQICDLVPAVPTDDNQTFWGYTSVPEHRVRWWTQLDN